MIICIACGSTLQKLGEVGGNTILICPNCGLGLTEGEAVLDYVRYHRDEIYLKENKQFENIFQKRVRTILRFKQNGSALEVGSSTGLLLSLLQKEGWKVQGIEPSKKAANYAEKQGIPTRILSFEKAKIGQKYDAVIFNHVLEHVDNPLEILKKAHFVLDKNGIIFIDVPHFGSFSAKHKKENWEYILPEEHKWHFTKKSLEYLLKKAGFKLIYLETHSGIWDYEDPIKELWQSLLGGKKRFFRNFLTALPAYVITKIGLGTGLTVIGRKE